MKPISPLEVYQKVQEDSIMIKVVNNLLVEKFSPKTSSATLYQEEIIDAYITAKIKDMREKGESLEEGESLRDQIFRNHLLDFEPFFEEAGWKVVYESPDRDENFKAYFKFTAKDSKQ